MDLVRLAAVEGLKLIHMGIIIPDPDPYQRAQIQINSLDEILKTPWTADFWGILVLGDLKAHGWHGVGGKNFKIIEPGNHAGQDYNRVNIEPYKDHISRLRYRTASTSFYPNLSKLEYRERMMAVLRGIHFKGPNFDT